MRYDTLVLCLSCNPGHLYRPSSVGSDRQKDDDALFFVLGDPRLEEGIVSDVVDSRVESTAEREREE